MNAFVALTDYRWFTFLSSQPRLEEVNFWQPGGGGVFKYLQPNELFLFKLHSPRNFIVGGGVFTHSSLLPLSLAWDTFGTANGAASIDILRDLIGKYRKEKPTKAADYTIGCILLIQPFFLAESHWIPVPSDWKKPTMQGKRYDLSVEPGLTLYRQVQERLHFSGIEITLEPEKSIAEIPANKFGKPTVVVPRLGQLSFRIFILDKYHRRCAVSGEKVVPVLISCHIKKFKGPGTHNPNNGILLRGDLHLLFDSGYATITPDYHFEVSKHVREDFDNGQEYYALHGQIIQVPEIPVYRPASENLVWHNENVYKG